jgi:aminopeptidase N
VIDEHQEDIPLVLDSASAQMRLLDRIVGPYPYNELDVVDLPGAFGGIEYPSLVTVGTLGSTNIIDPTVHEVAHQWFYGLIGNDQINEPWLDEAIATFAQILYYEDQGSSSRASGMLSNFRSILSEHPQSGKPIGQPVGEYASPGEYGLFVYLKGALFMERLRARMGEQQFYAFLQNYYQTYRYDFADSSDFLAVAESTCDCQLDDLFDLWVFEGGDPQLP